MVKELLLGISNLLCSSLSEDPPYSLHRFDDRLLLVSSNPLNSVEGEA